MPHFKNTNLCGNQRGMLLIVALLMLLLVSMIAVSTMDTTGLEMQMSSNNRLHLQVFEAAEFVLSSVEDTLIKAGNFSENSLNDTNCVVVCFKSNCAKGFCFSGSSATLWETCNLNKTSAEPYFSLSQWAEGSDGYQILQVPETNIVTKYIVEYWCFTAKNPAEPLAETNKANRYRIIAFVTIADSHAQIMLRSTVKIAAAGEGKRITWEQLDNPI